MKQTEWLIKQVTSIIVQQADIHGDFDMAVADAKKINDGREWVFDGPVTITGRPSPAERDSWARYSDLALAEADFDRAIAAARKTIGI